MNTEIIQRVASSKLRGLLQNKNTSAVGVLILVCLIAEAWLPRFASQLHTTREYLMVYGFLLAGDSPPPPVVKS